MIGKRKSIFQVLALSLRGMRFAKFAVQNSKRLQMIIAMTIITTAASYSHSNDIVTCARASF